MIASHDQHPPTVQQFAESLRSPDTKRLLAYWHQIRAAKPVPDRTDINPGDLGAQLPLLIILELLGPVEARIRLAGTAIRDTLRRDITGTNYLDLLPPERRQHFGWCLRHVATHPCGFIAHLKVDSSIIESGDRELLLLPVMPKSPGAAIQLLGINAPLEVNRFASRLMAVPKFTPASMGFLDLGSGIPAAG